MLEPPPRVGQHSSAGRPPASVIVATIVATGGEDTISVRPAALAALTLLFGLALLLAARGDLWLDEIWSLELARGADSAWAVLAQLRIDNNHPLNTLYLYLVDDHFGGGYAAFVYRLPAVVATALGLPLLARLARRAWGPREAVIVALLYVTAYPVLLWGSEARGYGVAMFAALGAATLVQGQAALPWPRLLTYWSCCAMGLLAHTSFAFVLAALVVGELCPTRDGRARVSRVARRHLVPLLLAAAWYLLFVRDLRVGGGPSSLPLAALGDAAELVTGLPQASPYHVSACLIVALVLGAALAVVWRERGRCFFLAVVLLPLAALLVLRPHYVHLRYAYVCYPFALLLVARLAAVGLARLRGWRGALPALLLAAAVAGQLGRDAGLFVHGRGGYSAALHYLAQQPEAGRVEVGGDHDFRVGGVFEFYREQLGLSARLHYVRQGHWAATPPAWIVTHDQDPRAQPPLALRVDGIGVFERDRRFASAAASGMNWTLYRRAGATRAP